MATAPQTIERPKEKLGDGDDDDKLVHKFCRNCMVHPDGKTCTVYCGKTCKAPPPPPPGKRQPPLDGLICIVCESLAGGHKCKGKP